MKQKQSYLPQKMTALSLRLKVSVILLFLGGLAHGQILSPFSQLPLASTVDSVNDRIVYLQWTGSGFKNVCINPKYLLRLAGGGVSLTDTIGGLGPKPVLLTYYWITHSFIGSTFMTTLGTITTGIWNASPIQKQYINDSTIVAGWAEKLSKASGNRTLSVDTTQGNPHGTRVSTEYQWFHYISTAGFYTLPTNISASKFLGTQKTGSSQTPTWIPIYAASLATSFDTTITHSGGASAQMAYFSSANNITSSSNHIFVDAVYELLVSTSSTGLHGSMNSQYSNSGAPAKSFWTKYRGTVGSPANVQAGDTAFYLSFHVYNNAVDACAHILGIVQKVSSGNTCQVDLELATSSINGGKVTSLVIDSTGHCRFKQPIYAKYLNVTDSLANVNALAAGTNINLSSTTGTPTVSVTGMYNTDGEDTIGSDSNSAYINCHSNQVQSDTVYSTSSAGNNLAWGIITTVSLNNFNLGQKCVIYFRKKSTKWAVWTFPATTTVAYGSAGGVTNTGQTNFTFKQITGTAWYKIEITKVGTNQYDATITCKKL